MEKLKISKPFSLDLLNVVDTVGAEILINKEAPEETKDKYLIASFKIRLLLLRIIQFIESKKEIKTQDIEQLNLYLNNYLDMNVTIYK